MEDGATATLEAVITQAGVLLARLEKYRAGRSAEIAALERTIFEVGARARRLGRQGDLGAASEAALLSEAVGAVAALHAELRSIVDGSTYRAAVAAAARADRATLDRILPDIFADLVPTPPPPALHHALDWSRRSRPRPPEDMLGSLEAIRRHGLPASADELAPGVDPELGAVVLSPAWPDGAPIALLCDGAGLGPSVLTLADTGQVLVHQARLVIPFTVVFDLRPDEVDEWVGDPVAYRDALAPLLLARGFEIEELPAPAAP